MHGIKKVQVYLFFAQQKSPILFLILKRAPDSGSYWQPITGMVESGECLVDAALRETQEETGISQVLRIIGPGHHFSFNKNDLKVDEYVFGIEVPTIEVKLSVEHSEYRWADFKQALALLYWESNRQGLRQLAQQILPEKSLGENGGGD